MSKAYDDAQKERDSEGKWLKGKSANPGGRPTGAISFTYLVNKRFGNKPRDADEIIEAVIKLAKMGEIRAIELLWERIDGKVVEKHIIEGELPITIQFVPAHREIENRGFPLLEKPNED